LISPLPFKGAVQGNVFESQVTSKMDGAAYTLLAVPPTSAAHL
jgi:hypothetical protein